MLFLPLVFTAASIPADQTVSIVEPGAKLEKLADGFKFTEGPACDSEGNIYFTDQPNDRIMIWDVQGKLSTFMQPCGRSNGLCFDAHDRLWACADENNQMWRIGKDKSVEVLVKNFEGKLLNGPNDVWVAPDGSAFFTDPFYKRDYWHRGDIEQSTQGVYWISPDAGAVTRVVSDMNKPNGIIGTPDGKLLYVADIGADRTYSYRIGANGQLLDKHLFCSMGSDGMTIDSDGNVYLTGHGVTVFDKAGTQIAHFPIEENWTGNICFGGKDRRTLFITASTSIYGIRMRTHGVGSQ